MGERIEREQELEKRKREEEFEQLVVCPSSDSFWWESARETGRERRREREREREGELIGDEEVTFGIVYLREGMIKLRLFSGGLGRACHFYLSLSPPMFFARKKREDELEFRKVRRRKRKKV